MANRNADHPWTIGKRTFDIVGSFGTNGSSAVVAANVKGLGFGYAPVAGVMTLQSTIPVRPGISTTPGIVFSTTGTYVVTLDDSYLDCLAFIVSLQSASGTANTVQGGPIANLGVSGQAPNFTIYTITSGSPANIAANASSRVNFHIQLRDSTTGFSKP